LQGDGVTVGAPFTDLQVTPDGGVTLDVGSGDRKLLEAAEGLSFTAGGKRAAGISVSAIN
jgi:hypothetical protein